MFLKFSPVAIAVSLLFGQFAFAQNTDPNVAPITRSLVDHTRTDRLTGVPTRIENDSPGAAGATLLPFSMPNGSYTNQAAYPLHINLNGVSGFSPLYIVVDGSLVAQSLIADDGAFVGLNAIIPSRSTFTIVGGSANRATALVNGATWQQTGVRFSLGTPTWEAAFVPKGSPINVSVLVCNVVNGGYFEGPSYSESSYAVRGQSCSSTGTLVGYFEPAASYNSPPRAFVFTPDQQWPAGQPIARTFPNRVVDVSKPALCKGGTRGSDNWGQRDNSLTLAYETSTLIASQCTPSGLQAAYQYEVSCNNPANANLPRCVITPIDPSN